jgi:hypothetical protein
MQTPRRCPCHTAMENQGVPTPCPSTGGWVPGTTCRSALMICDQSLNVAPMGFTYGYALPAGANNGTVVAFSGGNGTAPATSEGNEVLALQYYLTNHLEIVQIKWDSDWEMTQDPIPAGTYGNIQYAACRPAGFLHFVYTDPVLFQPGGGMCVHGFSAGSAAVVYSLAWYGAGWGATGYLDNVELLSGPVLSESGYRVRDPSGTCTCPRLSGIAHLQSSQSVLEPIPGIHHRRSELCARMEQHLGLR